MSTAIIGALIGGILGLVNFVILQNLATSLSLKSKAGEKSQGASVLKLVAWIDLLVFPLAGYIIAPMAWG